MEAHPNYNDDFALLQAHRHRRGHGVLRCLLSGYDLKKLHLVHWRKVVHSNHLKTQKTFRIWAINSEMNLKMTNLLWSLAGGSNILNGQSGRVGGEYAVRGNHLQTHVTSELKVVNETKDIVCPEWTSTYSLHLLQDCMLDVDVFKHSLDNHVSLFKATVIQLAHQVGQYGVPLK